MSLTRRSALLAGTAAALGPGTAIAPAARAAGRRPNTLYVAAGDSVQAAVTATPDTPDEPWTIVLAPGIHRETVTVPATKTGLTLLGANRRAADTVIVYDNAAGTLRPDGSGTYGTSGSATVTVQAEGFTARRLTFANDWLRAAHPGVTGTQAVAVKSTGDRTVFDRCRFLGHQDTLYADTPARTATARQYFHRCYAEGDVDFVFGRATAVFDRCTFRTLDRTDLTAAPYGFVFAPSTVAANPRGYLAVRSRITSAAPDGTYKLARPWVPSSDPTAVPMLTVRESLLGPGVDAVEPYANMSAAYPWQSQRFREYRNTGPGAVITDAEARPQLTDQEAVSHTSEAYLTGTDGWAPWKEC